MDNIFKKANYSFPLISVVVPIYNVEEYLPLCLERLASQTYPNIEVLMINDGSPDNSESICLEYADRYSNFYYYKKSNGGLSDARNYGIDKAKGEYIGFVDSDDYISSSMYLVMYQNIVRYDADIVAVGYEEVAYRNHSDDGFDGFNAEVYTSEEAIKNLFSNDMYLDYAWNKLYKMTLFDQIRYPIGKKMEDLGTTYKLFLKAQKVVYYPAKLYYYFQRTDSILHIKGRDFYEDKLALAYERYVDLKNKYPYMIENDTFFLNTAFDCLSYIPQGSEMRKKVILAIKSISNSNNRCLSPKRKIKFYLIKYVTSLYAVLF